VIEHPMERAIRLARAFNPHPNPRVGAVVVAPDGAVVGEGAHERPGLPHAEVVALDAAGTAGRGSTVFVTLEPCNHTGRTRPCVKALIDAGVVRVVIGERDPDQKVAGAGIAALIDAGLEVVVDGTAPGLTDLDPGYFHHRVTGRPRFTLKVAATLDGQVAADDGTSKWITGEEARVDGHRLRAESDAVLVGAGTIFTDDPHLDVRLPGYTGRQPRPVVVAGQRMLPPGARVMKRDALVIATSPGTQPGDELIVDSGPDGRPDLRDMAESLGGIGLVDVMVEGGPRLAAGLWKANLVDRGVWYVGAKVAGGLGRNAFGAEFRTLSMARRVEIVDVRKVGNDLRVEFVMEG
jgi:diaminohydroxyphosphoribosylaminopyrimidine deaminase/5-amino-6-(5-phosphoribosylamino)uracil reductase